MKTIAKTLLMTGALLGASMAAHAAGPNLLVNGDFEDGTHSYYATPAGWTNIGHSDGVIPYSDFGTPASR